MLTEEELYEGFSPSEIERIKTEVREKYDPDLVAESDRRIRAMSREQWRAVKETQEEISRALAGLMDRDPADSEVQQWIARHHAWIENFYTCNKEVYVGLARTYVAETGFRDHYDKYASGLADFMRAGMLVFAESMEEPEE